MQPETLVAPAEELRGLSSPPVTNGLDEKGRLDAALTAVREAFDASTAGTNVIAQPGFRMTLRTLAREIVRQTRPHRNDAWVAETLGIVKAVTAVGGYDLPASGTDLVEASGNMGRGWAGVIAAMLQAPSWELMTAPALDAVPNWLWSDYAAWLFSLPPQYAAFDAGLLAPVRLKRLQDLERWVRRNPGAASVRAAVDAFLEADRVPFHAAPDVIVRQQAEVRGKILAHLHLRKAVETEPAPVARHGRRLRVAFVARDFAPGPDLFETLPGFEQLDAKSFEVFLFPLAASDSPESGYCTRRTRGLQVLPEGTQARVELLRSARLDALVFVGDLSHNFNALSEIALHRIAPLQVVTSRSGATTGLPEIDLVVSGVELPAAAFSERIGVRRGPAHCFSFGRNGAAALGSTTTREELGMPAQGPLFAAVVDGAGVTATTLRLWTSVLAQSADAHLAIAFAHDGDPSLVARFCQATERALGEQNLKRNRVTVFPTSAQRPHELRALIGICDAVVDAQAPGLSGWTVAEALLASVPVVTSSDARLGAPAAFLQSLGLGELVAADVPATGPLLVALAREGEQRNGLRTRIAAALETPPDFLDALAASDAFGALLEAAFDEVSSLGRAEFRRQTDPIRCFGVDSATETIDAGLAAYATGDLETAALEGNLGLRSEPRNQRARFLVGQVLYAQGSHSRAVDYLLAAVQQSDATPEMWYALALALRENRQVAEAIQVLETCLRLDCRNVEVLLTLLELAERVGATEIAREVLQCLQEVAPEDPRVLAMS
ncbi:tetratricopeptide repeat protein [Horticoccus sp. 23ND18S-11]|uniref:tetratricopeptide repeat protein n=1 Tax=Horticoccus sp. 23ND18S-11 TaxID=3391832 RepID=UPI0039C9DB8D